MKGRKIGKRIIALVLVLLMTVPSPAWEALAAKGAKLNTKEGRVDTSDTIRLPIKIYDYEQDGMLFEFADNGVRVGLTDDTGTERTEEEIFSTSGLYPMIEGLENNNYVNPYKSSIIKTYHTQQTEYATVSYMNLKEGTSLTAEEDLGAWTGNHPTLQLQWLTDAEKGLDPVRYITIVYRTSMPAGREIHMSLYRPRNEGNPGGNADGNYTGPMDFSPTGDDPTATPGDRTYAVFDLRDNTDIDWEDAIEEGKSVHLHISFPIEDVEGGIDITRIAAFESKELAKTYGEYMITEGGDSNRNKGFGLLYLSGTHYSETGDENNNDYLDDADHFNDNDVYFDTLGDYFWKKEAHDIKFLHTFDGKNAFNLANYERAFGYTLLGTFGQKGNATLGMLESSLSDQGLPVYKAAVVSYLAEVLQEALEIPERNDYGWKNYRYVRGVAKEEYGIDENGNSIDLAEALRRRITDRDATNDEKMGTYAATKNISDSLMGTWEDVEKNISTYHDAAYFLLNNIFVEGSCNEKQDDFDYLVLNAITDTEGNKKYVFDSSFAYLANENDQNSVISAVNYNTTDRVIDLKLPSGKELYKSEYYFDKSNKTSYFSFLPIVTKNESAPTKSPYVQDEGVLSKEENEQTYLKRNYNYVLASEGQFVYRHDDNLFFEFSGDDDVYLFINNELVLDLGAAHSIDTYTFNLNDYVEAAQNDKLGDDTRNKKLSLVEGDIYSFKFFYMERHGTAANMRINTNIKVTDPHMETTKEAYQNDKLIGYGGTVDENKPIEYRFSATNYGYENLYNIAFNDPAIGVTIDSINGLVVTEGSKACNENGDLLTVKDIVAFLKHPRYDDIRFTFETQEELKGFMQNINSIHAVENGAGLWPESTLEIRGIYYQLTNEQKAAGVFDNVVYSSATNSNSSATFHGQDDTRVYTDDVLVYYEWAKHQLKVSNANFKDKILDFTAEREESASAKPYNVKSVELVDANGVAITNNNEIEIDDDGNFIVEYTTTGVKNFYLKTMLSKYNETETADQYGIRPSFGQSEAEIIHDDGTKEKIYVLDNAHGYKFTIGSGYKIIEEDSLIATTQTAYNACNPNWAVSVLLRKTEESDIYQVVEVKVNPGTARLTVGQDEIVMVVHSAASHPTAGRTNWNNRVLAAALKAGELVKVSSDYKTVEVLGVEKTVRGVVNVLDVKDSVFVLDYGLPVEVLANNALFSNDVVNVPGRNTMAQVIAIGSTQPTYDKDKNSISFDPSDLSGEDFDGKFVFDKGNQSLKYIPEKAMDGTDSIYVAVSVFEEEIKDKIVLGTTDIYNEVQMYKKISVLPANVVYYEDDSLAIHYTNTENIIRPVDSGSTNLTQSADQNQAYGQDDVYKDNANAEMSGNSITKIPVGALMKQEAYFDFKGTGFEIISRTNAYDVAAFIVRVINQDGTTIKSIPVIPEFDQNGDGGKEEIYQVPVVRVKGLTHGKYKVTITGIPSYDYSSGEKELKDSYIYIDGIRIYQPLGNDTGNYIASEKDAQFVEIRDLILKGQAAVAKYNANTTQVSTGTATWIENRNDTAYDGAYFEGNRVNSANDYLMSGPNNEVYMDGDYEGASALVFYVNKDANATTHNLQIALHAVDKGQFYGTYGLGAEAFVVYGTFAQNIQEFTWKPLVNLYSATEQYYTIDFEKCPYIKDRGYQVVLMVDSGMVSYTSLKYTGLTIGGMVGEGEVPSIEFENGIPKDSETGETLEKSAVPALYSLRRMLATKTYFLDDDTDGDNANIGDVEFGDGTEGDDDKVEDGDGNGSNKPEEDDTDAVKDKIKYQQRNDSDIRLVAYVDDITAYTGVSFTLTIDGKESQELVCTTAYAGLYANGVLKTTKDIYGTDGYFVVYTINGYLDLFAGQEVTIKVTYTTVTGETITQTRTTIFQ